MLYQALLEQIVNRGCLVVLITIQTLHCVVLFDPKALQIAQNLRLNRNFILTDYETLILTDGFVESEPGVLSNLLTRDTLVRIGLQNLI